MSSARYGWGSDFQTFADSSAIDIRKKLKAFVADASLEQDRAWSNAIPPLQDEIEEVLVKNQLAKDYSAILEYELPLESRRPDAVLLVGGGLLVVELKGKLSPSQADIDQVSAYARDLQCYHCDCEDRPVIPVLVPMRARGYIRQEGAVHIAGPDALDALVQDITDYDLPAMDRVSFLKEAAYRPMPTLVKAARELMQNGELRRIRRAHAATEPAVETIKKIVHDAAKTQTRHLILIAGVPGAGKTLVGLQTVHAHYLDDLSVDRGNGKSTAPAVFLSGNGPLVQVLQYELREAGGDGRTFVRDVKNYVRTYSRNATRVPPEHVLVYDEAQRAFDAAMVKETHKGDHAADQGKSEPELFVEFANRVPEWCVVIGLIGTGQEIHVGEEAGVGQWRRAVENTVNSKEWRMHVPPQLEKTFKSSPVPTTFERHLSLDVELRQHTVTELHRFVAGLLMAESVKNLLPIAKELETSGFHLRLTRDLDVAKTYLRDRYRENQDARFGIVASARDRSLPQFGVNNDFQSTKRVRFGPWYADGEGSTLSCRNLTTCVTEFGAQGLELDAALVAWGTDLRLENRAWSNASATGYKMKKLVRDARQLRINAYRVLLTRSRDAVVVFVPSLPELDETFDYLRQSGFLVLSASN